MKSQYKVGIDNSFIYCNFI